MTMQFAVLSENLKTAIENVYRVIDRNPSLPVLNNIALVAEKTSLTLYATNLDHTAKFTIGAKVDYPGAITLPAQTLKQIIALASHSRIDFALDDATQTMSISQPGHGRNLWHCNLKGISIDEFPPVWKAQESQYLTDLNIAEFKRVIGLHYRFRDTSKIDRYNVNYEHTHFKVSNSGLNIFTTDLSNSVLSKIDKSIDIENEVIFSVDNKALKNALQSIAKINTESLELHIASDEDGTPALLSLKTSHGEIMLNCGLYASKADSYCAGLKYTNEHNIEISKLAGLLKNSKNKKDHDSILTIGRDYKHAGTLSYDLTVNKTVRSSKADPDNFGSYITETDIVSNEFSQSIAFSGNFARKFSLKFSTTDLFYNLLKDTLAAYPKKERDSVSASCAYIAPVDNGKFSAYAITSNIESWQNTAIFARYEPGTQETTPAVQHNGQAFYQNSESRLHLITDNEIESYVTETNEDIEPITRLYGAEFSQSTVFYYERINGHKNYLSYDILRNDSEFIRQVKFVYERHIKQVVKTSTGKRLSLLSYLDWNNFKSDSPGRYTMGEFKRLSPYIIRIKNHLESQIIRNSEDITADYELFLADSNEDYSAILSEDYSDSLAGLIVDTETTGTNDSPIQDNEAKNNGDSLPDAIQWLVMRSDVYRDELGHYIHGSGKFSSTIPAHMAKKIFTWLYENATQIVEGYHYEFSDTKRHYSIKLLPANSGRKKRYEVNFSFLPVSNQIMQADNMPDDSPAIVESEDLPAIDSPIQDNEAKNSGTLPETIQDSATSESPSSSDEDKNKNPDQLLADATTFSRKNYKKAKATYSQNKTLIELAYHSAMCASVTGESIHTLWIDAYELEFKTWSNKMLVNSLITKQLVSRRKTEFETLQYKINGKGLAAIHSSIIYSDSLSDSYNNARNATGTRNTDKLEDDYINALEAYEAKNTGDSVVMNADIIRPDAEYFTQSIELEPDPRPDPEPTGKQDSPSSSDEDENIADSVMSFQSYDDVEAVTVTNGTIDDPEPYKTYSLMDMMKATEAIKEATQAESIVETEPEPTPEPDDSGDEEENSATFSEQLPARHNPTRPTPLATIQAGKWYIRKAFRYTSIVYVRSVDENRVSYHDTYTARFDGVHEAEKFTGLWEFKRGVKEANDAIIKHWQNIPMQANTAPLRALIEKGEYLEALAGDPEPDKIQAIEFTINWSESGAIETPATVKSWQEVESLFYQIAEANNSRGYDKTDFKVLFSDGSEYGGRYDVESLDREAASLARHMWEYQASSCSVSWWHSRKPEDLQSSWYTAGVESAAEWLLTVDFNGWQNPQFQSVKIPAIPRPEDKKPEPIPASPYTDRRPPTEEERQALPSRSLTTKETAKQIRADLKASYPGTKFSVKQERSTYSNNIAVRWVDGPAESAVKHLLGKYKSKSFDGMDDSTHFHYWIIEGELISYGGGYKSANRSYSYEFYKQIADTVAQENGLDDSQYEVIAPDEKGYKWASASLKNPVYFDNSSDDLGTLIWRIIKDTDARQPEAQAEAENNSPVLDPLPDGEQPLTATFYGSIWEITGDTKAHKDTIKQTGNGGQLRVRFDKWRKLWTVSGCGVLLATSAPRLARLCTIETPAQDENLKTETLRAARWGDVWRIWGDTKPVKDVIKSNGGKWNGNQWLIASPTLPDAVRALFDEDDEPTPPDTPPTPETDSFNFGSWTQAETPAQTTEEEKPDQGDSPLQSDEEQNTGDSAMAEKILSIAESYNQKIEDMRADRLTNTHKRATQDRNNRNTAQYLEKFQSVLVNLAACHEAGTVPELLQALTTKTALYYLYEQGVAPSRTIHKTHIPDLMKPDLTPAENLLIHKIKGRAEGNKQADYGWFYDEELPTLRAIERKAKKLNKYMPDNLDYERMLKAGITESNYNEARESLLALADESAGQESAQDKLKRLNSELIGRTISGYFPTPDSLVQRMLARAGVYAGDSVLEPSAGAGHILDHLPEGVNISAYEINSRLCQVANAKGHTVQHDDFMNIEPTPIYDFVLMNPPFENFQDIEHVQQAYKFLAPGGRLVSIMSESPFFRKEQKAQDFRDWLDTIGESEQLPDGSFLNSDRSTGVKTRLVTIDKPQAKPTPPKPQPEKVESIVETEADSTESPLPSDEEKNTGANTKALRGFKWFIMRDSEWTMHTTTYNQVRFEELLCQCRLDLQNDTIQDFTIKACSPEQNQAYTKFILNKYGQDNLDALMSSPLPLDEDKNTGDSYQNMRGSIHFYGLPVGSIVETTSHNNPSGEAQTGVITGLWSGGFKGEDIGYYIQSEKFLIRQYSEVIRLIETAHPNHLINQDRIEHRELKDIIDDFLVKLSTQYTFTGYTKLFNLLHRWFIHGDDVSTELEPHREKLHNTPDYQLYKEYSAYEFQKYGGWMPETIESHMDFDFDVWSQLCEDMSQYAPKSEPEPDSSPEEENKSPEFAPYEDCESPDVNYMAIDWESGKILAHFNDRVEKEDYKALRAEKFQHGRGSTTFYAVYTPYREKFLMDTFDFTILYEEDGPTMRERAENRSDRYSGYSSNAGKRADSRFGTAKGIADRIPFGQPILVGHHSEKHARRDQDKIHNNMRKGIEESEKSEYWSRRASSSISRVERREKPGATQRRIDRLEADLRKMNRRKAKADQNEATPFSDRWIWFYENRINFENALLGDIPDEQKTLTKDDMQVGGTVLHWGTWRKIVRLNKKTVTVESDYSWTNKMEYNRIKPAMYRPPLSEGENSGTS